MDSKVYEKLVRDTAKAMYEHERITAASKAGQIDLQTHVFIRLYSTAFEETDRAAAILVFAYIEDCLTILIERHFDQSIATTANLTGPGGLLARIIHRRVGCGLADVA